MDNVRPLLGELLYLYFFAHGTLLCTQFIFLRRVDQLCYLHWLKIVTILQNLLQSSPGCLGFTQFSQVHLSLVLFSLVDTVTCLMGWLVRLDPYIHFLVMVLQS